MKIKVLVVDDHDIARQGIKTILEQDNNIKVIGEASDGLQAVKESKKLVPDVILMDLRMPILNGIQAAKSILAEQPQVKILAISAFDGDEEVFGSIEAGICGYILKDIKPSRLGDAIRTVYEGKSQLDPTVAYKIINNISPKKPDSEKKDIKLTARENDVLQLLAEGLGNRDIGKRLWISEKTVKVYMSRLFKKLKANSRIKVILKAADFELIKTSIN